MPRITLKDLETDKAVTSSNTDALIGRDPGCALFIDGPNARVVSGQHARIFFQDSAWWIQDVSRNGTVLDQERLIKGERHTLRSGQIIGLGESGPRLRVETLELRHIAETVVEGADASDVSPRAARVSSSNDRAEHRPSDRFRGGAGINEATEPLTPAADWVVHASVRMTHTNQRIDVRGDVIRSGRSPECAVQIPPELGASVSRIHAEIAIQDGGIVVRDAGSRNGTFVNGNRVDEPHPAHRGDVVMLGPGGPSFTLEELRIVKGDRPGDISGPVKQDARLREPDTEPPISQSVIGRMLRGIGKAFGK